MVWPDGRVSLHVPGRPELGMRRGTIEGLIERIGPLIPWKPPERPKHTGRPMAPAGPTNPGNWSVPRATIPVGLTKERWEALKKRKGLTDEDVVL